MSCRSWFVSAICLAAIACAPKIERDLSILPSEPSEWSVPAPGAAEGVPDESWWSDFQNASLDEVVRTAISNNRDLVAASARVEQAVAAARIAGANLQPTVDVGPSLARTRQNFIGLPIGDGSEVLSRTFNNFGLSLDVRWEADLWGRLKATQRASLANAAASAADLEAARLSISGQAAKLWFAWAEAEQQVALAQKSVESFRAVAERVERRYKAGTRPSIDLRLARSNESSAEAQLQARMQQRDQAVRQLQILMGQYPSGNAGTMGAARLELPGPVPAGLPAELVSRRPDLIAAEHRLTAAEQQWAAAKRARYPRLTLTASGGTSSTELGDLLDGDFRVWSLAAGVLQPLFQGGRLKAQAEQAGSGVDAAVADFASAALSAYAEVETALASEGFLARQTEALEQTATQLEAAEALAESRYRNGVGSYIELLESQTRAFSARSQVLAARRAMIENRINLHLALGGSLQAGTAIGEPS